MTNSRIRYALIGALLILAVACGGSGTVSQPPTSTPVPAVALAPTPTATPLPDAPTATPVPTATPTPTATATPIPNTPTATPTPTSTPEPLPTVDDATTYSIGDYTPLEWIVPPAIGADGRLRLKVRVLDDELTLYPDGSDDGNGLDVNITGPEKKNVSPDLFGGVLPPAKPGWSWKEDPTAFVADIYDFDFDDRVLTVEVEIPARLAAEPGIQVALWTNPPKGERPIFVNRAPITVEAPN